VGQPTLQALQSIRAPVDDGEPVHVILDNLNHHRGPAIREWCQANNVELLSWRPNVATATASAANQRRRWGDPKRSAA
jgi:hypothetical protein